MRKLMTHVENKEEVVEVNQWTRKLVTHVKGKEQEEEEC